MSDTRVPYKPYIVGGASTSFVVPATSTALGIGDIPGIAATFYTGLRVYSTAKIGTNALLVKRTGDGATATLVYKSNGFIDCSNVGGSGQVLSVWRDAGGAGTLQCSKLYEQISGIASTGSTNCVLNIVNETMGVLSIGSDTNTDHFAWSGLTGIQTSGGKFSMVGTVKHLGGGANSSILGSLNGATNWKLVNLITPANTASAYQNTSTTSVDVTCSDDAWHGMAASMDNANSFMYVDATKVSTSTGSTDNIGDNTPSFMSVSTFEPYKGRAFEGALYGSALSDSQASAIAANIAAMIISAGLT